MKSIRIITLALALSTAFSCQSWLDVDPKSEVKSDKMFEKEQGFKDAIIGCYMLLSDATLYGKDLTAGFLEIAAQQFNLTNTSGQNYYEVRQWKWTSTTVRGMIDNIWNKMYNAVANVNNIIENIDQRRDVLHPTNYQIIRGEAYGLRGYLHFELLRMFGYGDLARHPEYMDKMTIPYSLTYNKNYADQYTQRKVIEMAISDLETAVGMLENYDPWSTSNKGTDYYLPNEDGFYKTRSTRFNYWAAQATLARIYMWTGEYDKALPILEKFLDSRSAVSDLRWISSNEINAATEANRDLTFSMEHIFRLDVHNLWDNLKINLDPENNPMGENAYLFYITKADVDVLYEIGDQTGLSDYRYTRQLNTNTSRVVLKKFIDFDNYNYPNRMPLIKLSEMYYMAAECLCQQGKTVEAVKLLNEVRENRGISPDNRIAEDAPVDKVKAEIEKEWKKEFLGEGQMFYYYKRFGASKMVTNVTDPVAVYVLPIPKDEIDVGGRENNLPEKE